MATSAISQLQASHTLDTISDNSSDWEYEYDENETEDIYFTLDLTTHVPNAIQEKQYAKNGKLIGLAAPEKNNAGPTNAPAADDQTNGHGDAEEPTNGTEPANDNTATLSAEPGTLQILDLHTKKPYVKFNNGFYSCNWFTDLGTQFWITNPGVAGDPRLSGHVLDVVSSSQTRLVAKPANLKRKRGAVDAEPVGGESAAQPAEVTDNDPSDVSDTEEPFDAFQDPTQPLVVPRQKIKDPHLEAQANFMERLSALKLKKGEQDAHKIPLKIPVYYKGAHNADALRTSHGTTTARKPRKQPQPTASNPPNDRTSPAQGEGTNSTTQPAPAEEEDTFVASLLPPPKPLKKTRGGFRGGTPSHAARRANLGLELMGGSSLPPAKKRGRPTNAERARRAAEAERAAAAATAQSGLFALDPQLASGEAAQTQGGAENDNGNNSVSARSMSREATSAASSTQGERPRKGRRSKEQMAEALRLEEERKAKLATAKAGKAGTRRESGASQPETEKSASNQTGLRQTRAKRKGLGLKVDVGVDGAADEGDGEDGQGANQE